MIEDLNSIEVGQTIWIKAEIVYINPIHNDLDAQDIAVYFIGEKKDDYNWMYNSVIKQAHLSLPTPNISIGDEVVLKKPEGEIKGRLYSVDIDIATAMLTEYTGELSPVPINPELQQLKELAEKYQFELVKKK